MSTIPLAIPNIGARESDLVMQCLRDNWVSTVGPFVERLEQLVAAESGVEHGVAVAAGTMGLHAALHTLGVGPGDLVVAPAFTFIGTANAIAHTGARPWFMEVTRESWTLDPAEIEAGFAEDCVRDADGALRLKATSERIAAIMPVYTLGTPADMDAIREISVRYGVPVVADAAAAIGARYKSRPIGALAELTVYSFNGNKTITTGGGGMIVGPDAERMKLVKHITTTARVSGDYEHDRVGFNYRMTNVEAAIGCAQMERLGFFIERKKRIREIYDDAFSNIPGVSAFPSVNWADSAYWLSGLVLAGDTPNSVGQLVEALAVRGISGRKFWKPMHLQKPFASAPRRSLSFTDGLWARVLTLPCSTSLTEEEQRSIVDILLPMLDREASLVRS